MHYRCANGLSISDEKKEITYNAFWSAKSPDDYDPLAALESSDEDTKDPPPGAMYSHQAGAAPEDKGLFVPQTVKEAEEYLTQLLVYMRKEHRYCYWCAATFRDEKDMDEHCPGVEQSVHDTDALEG